MKRLERRFLASVLCLVALLITGVVRAGPYENGTPESPPKRMPAGTYRCSMGSYAAKACQVASRNGHYSLTVTAGARFPFELELYPTDEADQLIGYGHLTDPGELCPACPDSELGKTCPGDLAEKEACPQQPLVISLRLGKNGVWSGQLIYYLVRGLYGEGDKITGWYRLAITDQLRVAPGKK